MNITVKKTEHIITHIYAVYNTRKNKYAHFFTCDQVKKINPIQIRPKEKI